MIGRIVNGLAELFTYDAENRLTGVSGGATASFVYDGDGKRVKGTVGDVTTVYIGNYYEISGSTIKKYYYAGSERVAMNDNGTLKYLLGDHLGSTSITADASGNKLGELRYKAWGETRYTWGTTPTSFRFTGQRSEESSIGLYYYGARWYDSQLGRFAQADTVIPDEKNPQAWDRYAGMNNNPLLYTDPTGHWPGPGNWSININTKAITNNIFGDIFTSKGLSDFANGADKVALGIDCIATAIVGLGTYGGAQVGGVAGVGIAYSAMTTLVQPVLGAANIAAGLSTMATVCSDMMSGNHGLNMSISSDSTGLDIKGNFSVSTASVYGTVLTTAGLVPGIGSHAPISLSLQGAAVLNDEGKLPFSGVYNASFEFSTNNSYSSYLPSFQNENERHYYFPFIDNK